MENTWDNGVSVFQRLWGQMDKLRIVGGHKLKGQIRISGAKNATLPLMAAAFLTERPLTLHNLPRLSDVMTLAGLLESMGVNVSYPDEKNSEDRTITLEAKNITSIEAPYDLVRKMRASILVLGPLLARMHEAKVSLPGGCAIGPRPINLHIDGLEKMGAEILIEEGYVHAKAPGGLKGAEIIMPLVSVTGTENLMMAATLAKGTTQIINAAQEPEVSDLANCLVKMGASISGIGTSTLTIEGQESLNGAEHNILADRIETGTYAIAAAITGGELELQNSRLENLPTFSSQLKDTGVSLTESNGSIFVKASDGAPKSVDITTEPYPGFATDLQAQFMVLMCLGDGASMIHETIFENRLMHVPELCRMGANITLNGSTALVRGVNNLQGAEVMATDLRASVSLVLAGLAAQGETIVNRIYHLDRGYETIVRKLKPCGAEIERMAE